MENEENVDLNEQIKGPIDDVTSVDIATQLSDCDDDEIKNVCRKLNAEKLASILEESELKTQLKIVDFKVTSQLFAVEGYRNPPVIHPAVSHEVEFGSLAFTNQH